ncbi:MAG: hypothetical protein Q8S00_02815 [Deltaproteobacteria bacterium]|nr:hypothetical protein [Deltaproteobacteria bacterium]
MDFYAVDVRDRAIQWVTRGYDGADNARFFLIEAGSGKQSSKKASRSLAAPNAIAVAIVIAAFGKNVPSQNNTRTAGFVTGVGN